MKIALLGYGRMGKAIEELAKDRGHEIVSIHDKDSNQGDISKADVAINFSIPSAAVSNLKMAIDNMVYPSFVGQQAG